MRTLRWPVLVVCAAILCLAALIAPAVLARGGGGGGGRGGKGGKRGGMGNAAGRGDYLEEMQRDAAEAELNAFFDDAEREPVQQARLADRLSDRLARRSSRAP